jgi:predicted CXXCH cytochrome family protein
VHQQIFDKACVECHSNHAVLKPSDEWVGSDPHALCATCHSGKDDKGAAAADAMRAALDRLNSGLKDSGALIARIHNAGIETGAQELALAEARTRLTRARTEVHTFDPARVDPVIADGLKIVADVNRAGQQGTAELRYRRIGLTLSLFAILSVVVALALKIRQIDARTR